MNNLPEDCQRLIWKKVFDGCLPDLMKGAAVRQWLLTVAMGDEHDLEYDVFKAYRGTLKRFSLTHEEMMEKINNEDLNVGCVSRLLNMVEDDNHIVDGNDIRIGFTIEEWWRLNE